MFNTVRGWTRLVGLVIYILLVYLTVLLIFPWVNQRRRHRLIKSMAARLPWVLGIDVVIEGKVPRESSANDGINPQGAGYLVVANHIAFVDVFVLDMVLPCQFVAKKEIASWPIFGTICKGIGTLFIDRKRLRSVIELNQLMATGLNSGRNVLFFPEGTTAGGIDLLPFHANLFECAKQAEADIVPIALHYTFKGEKTTLPSYAGKTTMWTALKRIVFNNGIVAHAQVGEVIKNTPEATRFSFCLESSAQISHLLNVTDQTALREAQRQAVLAQNEKDNAEAKAEAEATPAR